MSDAMTFDIVKAVGLELPGVQAEIRYDGAPVLKIGGVFVAAMASHATAEPDSLVVRVGLDERETLLEDAPDTYYIPDYYAPYPLVLVRLSRVNRDALHDLLSVSRRLALAKTRAGGAGKAGGLV